MSAPPQRSTDPAKIFLLPNLMTAGNLIFGFLAVLKIFEGSILRETESPHWMNSYYVSIYCILAACIFRSPGRPARAPRRQGSPFGREFDSLADIVSFGVAPALLVFKIVLYEIPHQIGWLIAGFYLLCGALRAGPIQHRRDLQSGQRHAQLHRLPDSRRGRADFVHHVAHHLQLSKRDRAGRGLRRHRPGRADGVSRLHDVQQVRVSELLGVHWRTQFSLPKFLGAVLILWALCHLLHVDAGGSCSFRTCFTAFYARSSPGPGAAISRRKEDDESPPLAAAGGRVGGRNRWRSTGKRKSRRS